MAMTFEEATLTAAKAVAEAPLNMSISMFHYSISSLVVRAENEYYAMTIDKWRQMEKKPDLVLTIGGRDSFYEN